MHQKKHVLLVGNFLSATRGTRTVCEELAERLTEAGWSVVTTSDKPGRIARFVDMVSTTFRRRRDYAVAQVDVYSGLAFIWAEAVVWVLRRLGKPYALTLHGGNLPEFARRWPRRVARLLRSAEVVTTPAPYLQKEMKPYRQDLRLLRNAIDLKRYEFLLREHPGSHLIWLRAFHAIYNPMLVPRTLAILRNEFSDIRITMVGPDKADGSLDATYRLADDHRVSDRIDVVGSVKKTDVPQWMNRGDIFLNTTNVDSIPVSVAEAMACGLCVVSTDVGGIPYMLQHEEDALLVPPDDPEAMASAIRELLTNSELATKLSRNARRMAEQFDWSSVLPQWETLLQDIADRNHL